MADELRKLHPSFTIEVRDGSIGGLTAFQGHYAYIECFRAGNDYPEPNCVAIEVCVRNLDMEPMLSTLDVSWGGDGISPCELASGLDKEIPWGESAVIEIQSMLPRLSSELSKALQSWETTYPSNQAKE
ncbi:hypothetical protein [Prosthecobacter sp.]|uniref:hypothetical protein n=1 Tax=Prosthecobacter sp. TaxID=1965333 RepID=UPI002AB9796D|nr:hypothetical protein [Prosthecobacter sp.]MDZ4402487.1 hypothetical protein [Prosthecobacter sp.]